MTSEIRILYQSAMGNRALQGIARATKGIFAAPVLLEPARLDLEQAYDSLRGQTNSTALLAQIVRDCDSPAGKRIAVVDVDLFIPILTFVFGEAQFGGCAAIVSTHRLRNQFYGLAPDGALLAQRLAKEVVHELGHTFGLYHCHQFECVMRASTYVEEIDMKRSNPCPACAAFLSEQS